MNLRTREGIVKLLEIEIGRSHLDLLIELMDYTDFKMYKNPNRERIDVYRQYLCEQLEKKYGG